MEKEEIEFFRNKLKSFYDEVTTKLLANKREADSKIDKTKIENVKMSHKGVDVVKSILKLGLKIIYMNKVSNNVTESDFQYEINDLIKSAKGEKVDGKSVQNGNYIYQSECFQYIINVYTKMRLLLENDDDVIKFVEALYGAMDVGEWYKYSDFTTAIMFLFKSGLINKKDYARAVVIEDLYKEYPGIIKPYKIDMPVIDYIKQIFNEYEASFGKKYEGSSKQK